MILASQSAARRKIFESFGIRAEIYVTNADENISESRPDKTVLALSAKKAAKAAAEINDPSAMIVAADTVVFFLGRILGKPKDAAGASDMLLSLSGNYHEVYSGISVTHNGKTACGFDVTKVKFRDIGKKEIEAYVKTGDPLTKAGAYGAEGLGSVFIEGIEGDFFNIAGLPVAKFVNILKNGFGMTVFDLSDLPDLSERIYV